MPSEGPRSGTTFASTNENGASNAWANPGNAASSNNQYAIATPPTQWLKVTDFGFSIPAAATIDGIVVEVECRTASGTQNIECRLWHAGAFGGSGVGSSINATESYRSYGSTSNLSGWSVGVLTGADVNASGFGVGVQGFNGSNAEWIDHVRMTVYYTTASGYSFAQVMG